MNDIYYEPAHLPGENANELAMVATADGPGYEIGFNPHWHAAVEITLSVSNSILLHTGGKTYTIPAGDFVYVNSNDVHGTETMYKDQRSKGLVLLISDQTFKSICPDFDSYRLVIPAGDPGRKEIIDALWRIYDHKNHPTPYDQAIMNSEIWRIVYLLTAYLVKKEEDHTKVDQRDLIARQVITYIDQHFREDLTLSRVAQKVGLQENYFCRYFKKYTGMSFSHYLAHVRLRCALAYMLDIGASVIDSALQAGFPSAKSFIEWCKRVYGITPTQYRRQQTEQKEGPK